MAITLAITSDFPVPGGPWTMVLSRSEDLTAHFWYKSNWLTCTIGFELTSFCFISSIETIGGLSKISFSSPLSKIFSKSSFNFPPLGSKIPKQTLSSITSYW
ncbi:MAG: hypothetical protein K2J69_00990 [Malacoplasma sp.]|nr:hypothetical protein [Malacoplasma sp.]